MTAGLSDEDLIDSPRHAGRGREGTMQRRLRGWEHDGWREDHAN